MSRLCQPPLANVLSERKHRTRLGLSKYAAEAAERAGESDGDLVLSRNARDVAAVHSTLWPEDHNEHGILNLAVLIGQKQPVPIPPREEGHIPEVWARERLGNANPHL